MNIIDGTIIDMHVGTYGVGDQLEEKSFDPVDECSRGQAGYFTPPVGDVLRTSGARDPELSHSDARPCPGGVHAPDKFHSRTRKYDA